MWSCANGRQVLFNRTYHPIYERHYPDGQGRVVDDHREWIEWTHQEWFFNDGNAPVSFGSGIPRWKWEPVVEHINEVLTAWRLPLLPKRPRK